MNHDSANGTSSLPPLPAQVALDSFFLDVRARLLDVAAILDRINRGPGSDAALTDPRMAKVRQALTVLHEQNGGCAERIQQLFSLEYDPRWERPIPR
jgi:hypothetical protein